MLLWELLYKYMYNDMHNFVHDILADSRRHQIGQDAVASKYRTQTRRIVFSSGSCNPSRQLLWRQVILNSSRDNVFLTEGCVEPKLYASYDSCYFGLCSCKLYAWTHGYIDLLERCHHCAGIHLACLIVAESTRAPGTTSVCNWWVFIVSVQILHQD